MRWRRGGAAGADRQCEKMKGGGVGVVAKQVRGAGVVDGLLLPRKD